VMTPEDDFKGTCWTVRFHPSGEFLVGAGGRSGGKCWFWKPDADKPFFSYKMPNVVYDLAFHPDGLQLAAALYDKTARLYTLKPMTEAEKAAAKKDAKKDKQK